MKKISTDVLNMSLSSMRGRPLATLNETSEMSESKDSIKAKNFIMGILERSSAKKKKEEITEEFEEFEEDNDSAIKLRESQSIAGLSLNQSFDSVNSQHDNIRMSLRQAKKSTFSKLASIKSMARKIKKNVKANISTEGPELDMYPGEEKPSNRSGSANSGNDRLSP